jgi:methylphosphotriester-DNA--protein-cysteine methyltransferase
MAADYGISTRTLHRHFLTTTGISPKKALQILRMRKALETISRNPAGFTLANFGYYDSSHFCKHLRSFLSKDTIEHLRPHLKILESMRQSG